MPPLEDIFVDLNIVTWMALIAVCLMVAGFVFDILYVYWYRRKKKEKKYTVKNEMVNGYRSRESIGQDDNSRRTIPSPGDTSKVDVDGERSYELLAKRGIIDDKDGEENEELMLVSKRHFKELEMEIGELKQALVNIVEKIEQQK